MIDTILKEISDGSLDLLLSKVLNEDKKDYFIKNNNTEIYHITSLHNQKNNEYNNNISIIDIGECENILKELYEIDSTETLILFKTDFYIDNYSIPITEYEIFHPQTKKKLDLKYCNQTKMKINLPVKEIDEEKLYIYDPNSDYYKDKCYPYTSEYENDDTLEERKNKFNNNYLSLCESNCKYDGYNKNTKMVLCECAFKSEFMKYSDIISKKDELLYYNFQFENDIDLFDFKFIIGDVILYQNKEKVIKEALDEQLKISLDSNDKKNNKNIQNSNDKREMWIEIDNPSIKIKELRVK
jgi:hypothetical protein